MDFVADQLYDGRKFQGLPIVDNYSRKCLAIEVDQGIKADQVVAVMERFKQEHDTVRGLMNCGNSFSKSKIPSFLEVKVGLG